VEGCDKVYHERLGKPVIKARRVVAGMSATDGQVRDGLSIGFNGLTNRPKSPLYQTPPPFSPRNQLKIDRKQISLCKSGKNDLCAYTQK